MKKPVVGADSPDVARDVLRLHKGGKDGEPDGFTGWFWRRFFNFVVLAVYIAATLLLVAVFWGLWLAAHALGKWMGL